MPPTSAKAWRTRSRGLGFAARASACTPRSGRNAARAPWESSAVEARAPRRARATTPPRRARAAALGRAVQAVGISDEPRRARARARCVPRAAGSPRRARARATSGRGAADLVAEPGHHVGEPVERVGVARAVLGVAVQRQVGQHDAEAVGEVLDDRLELRWLSIAGVQQRDRRARARLAVGDARAVGVVVQAQPHPRARRRRCPARIAAAAPGIAAGDGLDAVDELGLHAARAARRRAARRRSGSRAQRGVGACSREVVAPRATRRSRRPAGRCRASRRLTHSEICVPRCRRPARAPARSAPARCSADRAGRGAAAPQPASREHRRWRTAVAWADRRVRPLLRRSPYDREIFSLALPALGALAAEPLYLLADTAIVGHLGTTQLAALALAAVVLSTVVALCNFLTYATTAHVARLHGAGREADAGELAAQALWLALFIGCGLAIACAAFAVPLMSLLGGVRPRRGPRRALPADQRVRPSLRADRARRPGLAARDEPACATPLVILVAANTVNVVLEVVLVYGLDLGLDGSALGTVLAQAGMGAAFAALLLRAEHSGSRRPRAGPACAACCRSAARS